MRLSDYPAPINYIRAEHGAETAEEASRALGRLLAEQDRVRVQVEDLVKAINTIWPEPLERLRAEHSTV